MPLVSLLPKNFTQMLSYFFENTFDTEVRFGRFRVDFYSPELKLAFEYDGIQHYSVIQKIESDVRKRQFLESEGITLKRWPYYFMPTPDVCSDVFGPHYSEERFKAMLHDMFGESDSSLMLAPGFHKTANVPANFTWLGIDRFLREITSAPESLKHQVIYSLRLREKREPHRWLVVPEHHPDFMELYECSIDPKYLKLIFPLALSKT
jgi:hypothetical protein